MLITGCTIANWASVQSLPSHIQRGSYGMWSCWGWRKHRDPLGPRSHTKVTICAASVSPGFGQMGAWAVSSGRAMVRSAPGQPLCVWRNGLCGQTAQPPLKKPCLPALIWLCVSSFGRKKAKHMHTDLMIADGIGHREEESERRTDEGDSTALCISDHQLRRFAGVRGVTPVSHSMVKDLLPWQPQSDSLANITASLLKRRSLTLTDSRNKRLTWGGERTSQDDPGRKDRDAKACFPNLWR